jgi:hypothetical protein
MASHHARPICSALAAEVPVYSGKLYTAVLIIVSLTPTH